jgi:hypothetical protein
MPKQQKESAPIIFEAALSQRGKCFSMDSDLQATLVLEVPPQFSRVLSENVRRLNGCTFIVRIEGLEG